MRNANSILYGVEGKAPVKIIQYWPYEAAHVQPDLAYTLGDHNTPKEEAKLERELCQPLLDELRRLQRIDAADKRKRYTPDNKEVFLYENSNGHEIAVLFKDDRIQFGLRNQIRVRDPNYPLLPRG